MCGIAGAFTLDGSTLPDKSLVARLTDCLAHRGPDGTGVHVMSEGKAVLGHRRLSVIDLELGAQPMLSEDGSYGIVFNGEIYNYRELRDELESAGVHFRTKSDTEVLLCLLRRDGETCLSRLRGMFAFAFWDGVNERAIIARDRLGKKPLYYMQRRGLLTFASALSALRDATPGPWIPDARAIDAYMSLGYIPAPDTVYEGVYKLEAGTYGILERGTLHTTSFWNINAHTPFDGTFDEALDRLNELLEEAVRLRLRSDVPLGVFLSGGIDSSLVSAVAQKLNNSPIDTFSIAFDHEEFDESEHAAEVAKLVGTNHHRFTVHADVLSLLPKLAHHYGEPFADSSAIPTYILSEHTRKHVTVALGGDGGDEVFAGYNWYRTATRLAQLADRVPAGVANALSSVASPLGAGLRLESLARAGRAFDMIGIRPDSRRFAGLRSFVNEKETSYLYGHSLVTARASAHEQVLSRLTRLFEQAEGSPLRRMRVVDISTYLADCLLPKVDVASMAHSLEARAPLLDHSLVEFGLALPDDYLIYPQGGKRILRSLLDRYFPKAFFDRPKQGFSLPLSPWFRGELRSRVQNLTKSARLLDSGWFRRDGIKRIVDEHDRGARDHSQRIFALLMLECWLEAST